MNALVDPRREASRRRRRLFQFLVPALLLSLLIQALVGTEQDNLAWSAASAGVILLTFAYCFRPGLFDRYPLSTLAILGFDAVMLSIPLAGQSATLHPLLYNLYEPQDTFLWTYATHAVIIAAHAAYDRLAVLNAPGRWLARRVYAPLGLFTMPSSFELWMLGGLGFLATLLSQVLYVGDIEYGDVGGKALGGLFSFLTFPFLIPFRGLFVGRKVAASPLSVLLLVGYFFAVVILAIAINKRFAFSLVGMTVLLAFALLGAMGRFKLSSRAMIGGALLVVASVPVLGALEDLTTAMEIVRGAKGSASGLEYLSQTLDEMGDKAAIERWRRDNDASVSSSLSYSDAYLSSNFLNRLIYLKYTDITMVESQHLSDRERSVLQDDLHTRLLAFLPTPIASLLGINVDKRSMEYSVGDLYENFYSGMPPVSFLTGSSITHSKDVFGSAWLPIMFLIFLLCFNSADALTTRYRGIMIFSPVAFAALYTVFGHLYIEDNVTAMTGRAFRDFPQTAMLYIIISQLLRLVLAMGPTRRASAVPA